MRRSQVVRIRRFDSVQLVALALVLGSAASLALVTAGSSSAQAQVCPNNVVEPPETCDPPGTPCLAGSPASVFVCAFDCQCTCANGVKDPNEDCDASSPTGSFCVGGPCNVDCSCPTTTTLASTTTTTTASTTTT